MMMMMMMMMMMTHAFVSVDKRLQLTDAICQTMSYHVKPSIWVPELLLQDTAAAQIYSLVAMWTFGIPTC